MKSCLCIFTLLLLSAGSCRENKSEPAGNGYYREKHRPRFHFSPEKAWMNDPNGLVYYMGEYHLFYQYYPDSTVWGPMHWAHAVSTDLVHWQHLPIALYPDSMGYIFSGSAVVDENNTSGFQQGDAKPMAAIFTYHNMEYEKAGRTDRESQGIAYSLDKGRTWKKYAGNPVIKNKGDLNFRDPKVFWYEEKKVWMMSLAVGDHLEFYASTDLKDWKLMGAFGKGEGSHGGVWECPDLFPVKTEKGEKWVLLQNMDRGAVSGGSGTQYFVGSFDGSTFKNDNPPDKVLWLDYGADNYAGVTWFNAPDNRRIFIGWMSNWNDYATKVPTEVWRSAMTVPRELTLKETPDGWRLFQQPVAELEKLRKDKMVLQKQTIKDALKINMAAVTKDIELTFDVADSAAGNFGFLLSNSKGEQLKIGYDSASGEFFIDRTRSGKTDFSKLFPARHKAPYKLSGTVTIRALIDAASAEVFIDGGKLAMTDIFFPQEDFTDLILYTEHGMVVLESGVVYGMESIW